MSLSLGHPTVRLLLTGYMSEQAYSKYYSSARTRRGVLVFAVLVFFVTLVSSVAVAPISASIVQGELAFMVLGVVGMVLLRCPRCGKGPFRRGNFSNAFARQCMNCELPIYRDGTNR